jgi:hypothetical protein
VSDQQFKIVIAGFGVLNTVGIMMTAYYSRRTEKNTNSLVTRLLQTSGDAREAVGKLKGKAEEKAKSRPPA